MDNIFNGLEALLFTKIFGQIDLYTIISLVLKFVFVVIVLVFIARIVRMITLDIRQTVRRRPVDAASLKLLHDPSLFDFPIRDEYFLSDNTSIGRADDNNIVIHDRRMSKHQARIVQNGTQFFIDDLQATNPTLVNEEPVDGPRELMSCDIVNLGGIDFLFLRGDEYEE